jgi:hypothetical protein
MKKLFEGLILYLRIRKIDELRVRLDIEDSMVASEEYMDNNTSSEINLPTNFTKIFEHIFINFQNEIESSFHDLDIPKQEYDFGNWYRVIFNINSKQKTIDIWAEIDYKSELSQYGYKIPVNNLPDDDQVVIEDLMGECDCNWITVNFLGDNGEFMIDENVESDGNEDIDVEFDLETIIHDISIEHDPHWYSGYGGHGSVQITIDELTFIMVLHDYETEYDSFEETIDINFFD